MYGYAIRTWSAVCTEAPHSQFGEGARPHLFMDYTSPQAIKLNPSCSGQAHPNMPGTGPGYKVTEPGCTLRVPSVIRPVIIADAKSGKDVLNDSAQLAQTGVQILVYLGKHLRTHFKDHAGYDQGPEISVSQANVSLLVGKAQLVGCLKVL